jgi:hypothetical protein
MPPEQEKVSRRLFKTGPELLALLAAVIVVAMSLGSYILHYFPYEDDFSLIRYSAAHSSSTPTTWITRGFSDYFANDPKCPTLSFGFDRPVANATFYLESLLGSTMAGPHFLLTNLLCWLVSAWLVYGLARRLGASRWMGAAASFLYALSPCWYRDLIHAAFRNNGIAACCVLTAWYLLTGGSGVRSWRRALAAGVLVALGGGAHEQALTSLGVLIVAVFWLSYQSEERWTPGKIAVAITAVVVPSLLMVLLFHAMNPAYGTNYAGGGLLNAVSQSDRLASWGVHSLFLVRLVKLAQRLVYAVLGVFGALTPVGGDNMAGQSVLPGVVIFLLTITASIALVRQRSRLLFPLGVFLLYALGRSIGMPSAESRFLMMEVAWGLIVLACTFSAATASRNRLGLLAGGAAMGGVLVFNLVSYNATIVHRQAILLRREESDRAAFERIHAAATKYPGAEVVLVNDQEGMWSGRAMLQEAGFDSRNLEILPTIGNYPSTDVLRDVNACPVTTDVSRNADTINLRLSYRSGCSVATFGRDLGCDARNYRLNGRINAAAWSTYLLQTADNQWPPPLIHEVPVQADKPLVVIAWRQPLTVPEVITAPTESVWPADRHISDTDGQPSGQ